MSNEDSFYPRLIIQEYFDTLASQLHKETEVYVAEHRLALSQSDVDRLTGARRLIAEEIARLKEANLKSYARHSDAFLRSLNAVRQRTDMSEEKKINVIYKMLFGSGYCFFIESTEHSLLKRLVVLDCFPNNNNIYDNTKEDFSKYHTELNEEWIISYLISLELESVYNETKPSAKYIYKIERSDLYKKQKLNLSKFHFTTVDKSTFTKWRSLRKLDLSGNQIERVDANLFQHLTNLEELFLSCNKIKSLESSSLTSLKSIRVLSLAYNRLTSIDDAVFQELQNLEELNLASNAITSIQTNAFQGLKKLRRLNLSFNQLDNLHENVFKSQLNLQDLILNNNKLSLISPNLFKSSIFLRKLNLAKNHFKMLNPNLFDELPYLEELNLSFIDFKNIVDWRCFQHLAKLKSLAIFKYRIDLKEKSLFSQVKDFRQLDVAAVSTDKFKPVKTIRQTYK